MQNMCDIFIIGGGINGVGIANDACGRGLSVTLCEKGDLAYATSSASSKLIHGGLRYLEHYDFQLVRKALEEREILLKIAPHLIFPLEFILPHEKHLRPAFLIRIGLWIYDHLTRHPNLPNSKKISLRQDIRGLALKEKFNTGFSYYDCHTDDARLVILNAIAARDKGAIILTQTTCVAAIKEKDIWKIETKDLPSGKIVTHYAKFLINASGPWVAEVHSNLNLSSNPFALNLIKGSHIIIDKLYEGDFAYILQNADKRIVFAIPYQEKFTLIGTTDVPYTASLENITCSLEEKKYLCQIINHYFKKHINLEDIRFSFAGVRALQTDNVDKPSKITRDYRYILEMDNKLLTIISGKLTTYRRLAQEIVDNLQSIFPHLSASVTATTALPGGDMEQHNFVLFFNSLQKQYPWLPTQLCFRYAKNYGTLVHKLLANCTTISDLGNLFGCDLYTQEIDYLITHEWARSVDDILWRRTKLGLYFTSVQVEKLQAYLNECFAFKT
jgi:glycerol-3-phosphate dehydrogenase